MKYIENITAAVGDTVLLLCNTSSRVNPVWQYRRNGTAAPTLINNVLGLSKFNKVGDVNNGDYSMKLSNVQLNNSGWYECLEDRGKGPRHVTVMNITG